MSAELIAQIRATHIDGHAETCDCGQLGLCSTDWERMPCSALRMADELEAATAKLQALREIHYPVEKFVPMADRNRDTCCSVCGWMRWPCPTAMAAGFAGVDGEPT